MVRSHFEVQKGAIYRTVTGLPSCRDIARDNQNLRRVRKALASLPVQRVRLADGGSQTPSAISAMRSPAVNGRSRTTGGKSSSTVSLADIILTRRSPVRRDADEHFDVVLAEHLGLRDYRNCMHEDPPHASGTLRIPRRLRKGIGLGNC